MAGKLLKLTASSLLAATMLAGCKPAALTERPRAAGADVDIGQRLAARVAEQAARAQAMGDHEAAVSLAEQLVALSPQDAGYRTRLALSYLKSGRFVSADQAYADVIRLMPDNDKARVAQAVAKIAQGDREGARRVLADVVQAPADDLGLALALAGETGKAVAVLEPAARGMRGTSRTRQNLALAYALDGQWDKARAVAAQDVSPADIDRRMESWAQLASPDARPAQVAALLGATAVMGDPGQPMMLALAPPAVVPQPVVPAATAAAEVKAVEAAAPQEPQATAMAVQRPEPAVVQTAESPAVPVAPAPDHKDFAAVSAEDAAAPVTLVAEPVVAATLQPVTIQSARTPSVEAIAVARPVTPVATALSTTTRVSFERASVKKPVVQSPAAQQGEWVVQLGAYRSGKRVEAGWVHLTDNFKRLAQYTPSHSVYTVKASGAVFHRLSVTGFASRSAATAMCQAVKGQGGNCFVRQQANDAPMLMASKEREQLAGL